MMSILLPIIVVAAISSLAMAVLYSMVIQGPLQAATVDPFAPQQTDNSPAADTLVGHDPLVQTTRPTGTEWKVATLSSLSQVEDLLDSLESSGVTNSEVHALSNHCFAVRWK